MYEKSSPTRKKTRVNPFKIPIDTTKGNSLNRGKNTIQRMKKQLTGGRPNPPDGGNWALPADGNAIPGGAKRHHIIPYQTIRDFANTVVLIKKNTERRRINPWLVDAVGTAVATNKNTKWNLQRPDGKPHDTNVIIDRTIREGNYYKKKAKGQTIADDLDFIHNAVTWMPGNIFIGPGNRSDDPGNGFDAAAKNIVGNDAFFKRISSAYIDMKHVIATKKAAGFKTVHALSEVARIPQPYPYKANQWGLNANGKYHVL